MTLLTRHNVQLILVRPIVILMVESLLHQSNVLALRKRFAAQNIPKRCERILVRPYFLNVKASAHFALVLWNALLNSGHLLLEVLELGMCGYSGHGSKEIGRFW